MKRSKNVLPILGFPKTLLSSLLRAYIESSERLNIGSRLYNAKFGQQIQIDFSEKATQTLKLFKNVLSILEFPINLLWSLL